MPIIYHKTTKLAKICESCDRQFANYQIILPELLAASLRNHYIEHQLVSI